MEKTFEKIIVVGRKKMPEGFYQWLKEDVADDYEEKPLEDFLGEEDDINNKKHFVIMDFDDMQDKFKSLNVFFKLHPPKCYGIFLIAANSPRINEYEEIISTFPNRFNVAYTDIPWGIQQQVKAWPEALKMRQATFDFQRLNSDFEMTLNQVRGELGKVKSIHQKLVPERSMSFKNLKVWSKYSAGSSIGGEFYEAFEKGNDLYFILSSSKSYIVTSTLLKNLNILKNGEEDEKSDLALEFINTIKNDLNEIATNNPKKNVNVELFLLRLNLASLKANGYHFGKFYARDWSSKEFIGEGQELSHKEIEIPAQRFEKQFTPGEKFLILSPGFLKNYQGQDLEIGLSGKKDLDPRDLLDELFFDIKKEASSDFLEYDATSLFIEVNKNAMVEVS